MKVRRVDFSPDEWIGGTIGLSNADRGLYITACAMIYSAGKSIKISDLFAACVDHGNALKTQLDRLVEKGKLLRNGDKIDQKRARKELQKAQKRSRKARQNGLKGGRPPNNISDLQKPDGLQDSKAPVRDHQPSTTNHQPEEKKKDHLSGLAPQNADAADLMSKIWNEECGSIARANKANPARRANCAKRWREEFGSNPEAWRAYCRRIAAAPHLRGENDRGWRVDLDWVLKPENLTHITEGRYDPRLANGTGNAGGYARPDAPAPSPEEIWGHDLH